MPEVQRGSHLRGAVTRLPPGPSSRLRWGESVSLQVSPDGGFFDLGNVGFAEATLALRLAAKAAVQDAANLPFEILPPRSTRVRQFLARAGLAEAMGIEQPPSRRDILLPITRIACPGDVEEVAERLLTAVHKHTPSELEVGGDALMLAFSELCDNACTHGHSDHGAFVLAHRFGASRLVLAVGDIGVGIPEHLGAALGEALSEADEGEVIAEALKPDVTGIAHAKRGNGLPKIIETISELDVPEAEFGIWSGVGRVTIKLRNPPANRRNVRVVESLTQGTWTEVVLTSKAGHRAS